MEEITFSALQFRSRRCARQYNLPVVYIVSPMTERPSGSLHRPSASLQGLISWTRGVLFVREVQAALFFLQFFSDEFLEIQISGNKNLFRFISEYFLSPRVTIPDLLASDAFEQHLFVRGVGVSGWLGGTE